MSLLSIPTELRLAIYTYLADLQPNNRYEIRPSSKLTPPICRVSQTIRNETLPIFAKVSAFNIPIDDASQNIHTGISTWLSALGPKSTSRIHSLTISQHWAIPQPLRWQGHVGFYVQIQQRKPKKLTSRSSVNSTSSFRPEWNVNFVHAQAEGIWEVTTGTYPRARDMQGMRLESVELLAEIVRHHLHVPTPIAQQEKEDNDFKSGLTRSGVQFLVQAMNIVASHPISTYDLDQAESARRRRLETWSAMEQQLRALNLQSMTASNDKAEPNSPRRFFTPY